MGGKLQRKRCHPTRKIRAVYLQTSNQAVRQSIFTYQFWRVYYCAYYYLQRLESERQILPSCAQFSIARLCATLLPQGDVDISFSMFDYLQTRGNSQHNQELARKVQHMFGDLRAEARKHVLTSHVQNAHPDSKPLHRAHALDGLGKEKVRRQIFGHECLPLFSKLVLSIAVLGHLATGSFQRFNEKTYSLKRICSLRKSRIGNPRRPELVDGRQSQSNLLPLSPHV